MSHEQLKDVLEEASNETFTNQKQLVAFIFEMPTKIFISKFTKKKCSCIFRKLDMRRKQY